MTDFKNITDIFFDLDHTIYDFDKNAELTFNQVFNDLNLDVPSNFMEHFKPINDYYWDLLAKKEITAEYLRFARLNDTFQQINFQVSDETINEIASRFIENLTNYNHVFEGAYEILDYLKDKYRLHIITNGPDKVQELKLKNSNLNQYFCTVTNSELAGAKKPDARIFKYALNLANVKPEHSLMIGDNLDADIKGALNIGMQVVWFDEYRTNQLQSFTTINKLNELKKIL
ncbi:noncanonical pyrimidine nucleotidase, YjjG family [Paenimyroides tangerinum]|uniref:Noncanonical pyrimidine nucleotidase, YjjG family n=1 Tax=Paenimyroides tangerinum TaxID=2488728 RepID=A0A3P3W9A2_9FLAO|nr:YjjG family noncanonical pyrimidine nucleotidase [Paenimyroides tangerinum]RRJ90897.1 noncanonical pyrimidine nucleotidase, YjjG family [Paenimyroides tangerinum]